MPNVNVNVHLPALCQPFLSHRIRMMGSHHTQVHALVIQGYRLPLPENAPVAMYYVCPLLQSLHSLCLSAPFLLKLLRLFSLTALWLPGHLPVCPSVSVSRAHVHMQIST